MDCLRCGVPGLPGGVQGAPGATKVQGEGGEKTKGYKKTAAQQPLDRAAPLPSLLLYLSGKQKASGVKQFSHFPLGACREGS